MRDPVYLRCLPRLSLKSRGNTRKKSISGPITRLATDSKQRRASDGGSRGSNSKWSDTSQRKLRRSDGGQKNGCIRTALASGLGIQVSRMNESMD